MARVAGPLDNDSPRRAPKRERHAPFQVRSMTRNITPYALTGTPMTALYLESVPPKAGMLPLIRGAIAREMASLELAVQLAYQRLTPFEQKYGVTSAEFITHYTAEDLSGGDEEYVQWAGEYQLLQKLVEKLSLLKEIHYHD